MKAVKYFQPLALAASLVCVLASTVALAAPIDRDPNDMLEIRMRAGVGFHTGDLQWSIASDSTGSVTPNILSELTFEDVEYETFTSQGTLEFFQGPLANFILQARYEAGEATSGRNQDSDYHGDNRTQEYSRSYSDGEGSETDRFEFSLGYKLHLTAHWFLTPKLGYSFNQQHMKMTNGVQVLDTRSHALSLGPFENSLNSSYTAEWEGFSLAAELGWQWQRHQFTLEVQTILQDYYAEADWNLREDFAHPVSFAHWSEGTGLQWSAHYRFQFSQHFSAWVEATGQDFEADPGRDVVYFADGSKGATRLNGVTWESSGYALGVEFNF